MSDSIDLTNAHLLVEHSHGEYIPKVFIECYDTKEWGVSQDDAFILYTGPENPAYWDVWNHVIATAKCTDPDGRVWYLYVVSDGDLWAIPAK